MPVTVITHKSCGFCASKRHTACSIGTKNQGKNDKYPNGVVWACGCQTGGCSLGRRKCANCGNKITEEVSAETWTCIDAEACQASVERKRENDPFTAQLREIQEKVKMAKVQETEKKAEKAKVEKAPTYCLVTGEQTKGGLFKPGMDARYVSLLVEEVESGGKTEDAAKAKMAQDGVSDALKAKFIKSLGLARARAVKAKEAKEAKEAKAAEKASASVAS